MAQPIAVLREAGPLRWGGHVRRRYVLEALAATPGAIDVRGWAPEAIARALPPRRLWVRRPWVAAATLLSEPAIDIVKDRGRGFAIDVHDDPVAQVRALGMTLDPDWVASTTRQKELNLETFRWHVAPSSGIAAIAGLDPERTVIAPNGTDTSLITPGPWPAGPTIGMVSGAAPARGIETLVDAGRLLRAGIPDLTVILWLAGTGPESEAYLSNLRSTLAAEPWVQFRAAPYESFGRELAMVGVHCVPTPPTSYWDVVSPIKLFDAMASGRPVVVTPRPSMADDVERYEAGVVTSGDAPADVAEAIGRLLADEDEARRLGANGRRAVERDHDWRAISARLADELLRRGL